MMANILQIPIPVTNAAIAWPTRQSDVSSLLFINQDLNNTIWIGQQSSITAGGPNTIPIPPNGTFSGDASSPWYVIGSEAGTQPLVVVPNGQAYFLGLTQGRGNLAIPSVQSPGFKTGVQGWRISKDGNAEFNDVITRGTFESTAADGQTVTIIDGTVQFNNNAPLVTPGQVSGSATLAELDLSSGQTSNGIKQATMSLQDASASGIGTPLIILQQSVIIGGIAFLEPSGDPSGATDATVINSLIQTYEIQLMPGVFNVNAPIELPGYAILRGSGRPPISKQAMTVIKAAAAMPAVICSKGWLENTQTTPALGVNIKDMLVYGNGLASNGIVLQTFDSVIDNVGVENVLFQPIEFTAVSNNGSVIVSGSASNNRVQNCSIHTCGGTGIATVESGGSVFTDGFITDCIISGTAAQGISIQKSAGWLISGNHLYGLSQHGIQAGVMDNTRIVNNYIEPWGQGATLGAWRAIDGHTIPTNVSEPSVISGNTLWLGAAPGNAGSSIEGISLEAATGVTASWSVTGNTLHCVPSSGFTTADAIVWTNQASTSVINAVSTGNLIVGNWSSSVVQVPNGGTINLTTGV